MPIQVHNLSQREFEGPLLLSALDCLIRPRGTLVQSLLTSKRPAHHSAILVFTDPAVCSFSFAACYLSAGGLYSLAWASLYRLRGTLKLPLLEDVRPLAHCAGDVRSVVARPHAAVVSPLPTVQCRGLYSLERASLYRLGRALTHPLLKRVMPLPPSASVVRNDPTDAHAAVI